MSEKYLIFGATGSIGSSLADQLKSSGYDIHLVARNESEVSALADKLGCPFTLADVLEEGFIELYFSKRQRGGGFGGGRGGARGDFRGGRGGPRYFFPSQRLRGCVCDLRQMASTSWSWRQ